jgi:hypothetical protein
MRRWPRAFAPLLVVLVATAACGSDSKGGSDAKGTAISVDGTKVPAAGFVDELRIIADNEAFAKVLKREDDTILAPKPDTIDPLVSQSWVSTRVNQIIADREFRRRKLEVTPDTRARARRRAAQVFRGAKVFDAFPKSFQDLVIARQQRMDALEADLPKKHEPSEADLSNLYIRVEQTCQQGKLIYQIYVDTKEQADAIATELAQGADFATLARERSTDTTTKDRGGLTMCIGATRWLSSVKAVQDATVSTPIGGTSAPIKTGDGYTVLRVLPLTFDNARPLVIDDWHSKHPSALYDLLAEGRNNGDITIAERFAGLQRTPTGTAITPPPAPVRL